MTTIKKIKHIRVAELFAGVGGFRLGLEGYKGNSATSRYKRKLRSNYRTVWSNQYEPATKAQHASNIYVEHFGSDGHVNENITTVSAKEIADHHLLVGGFPCQDFSIANPRNRRVGLQGRKGILWWQIHRVLEAKLLFGQPTQYLLLENVDRLLTSRNGQDFHSILSSLNRLGYTVEWRVINAAEYGFPQRRRRVFILAYHASSKLFSEIVPQEWLREKGILVNAFPIASDGLSFKSFDLNEAVFDKKSRLFENAGILKQGQVTTGKVAPKYNGTFSDLSSVLQQDKLVPARFYIRRNRLAKWRKYKAAKNEKRIRSDGLTYYFKEGAMPFPDALDKPSRTIITSEGSSSPSRTTHVIKTQFNRHRRLTPVEMERLNLFPDGFTQSVSDVKRGFLMGNALVVGVVERIGAELAKRISE